MLCFSGEARRARGVSPKGHTLEIHAPNYQLLQRGTSCSRGMYPGIDESCRYIIVRMIWEGAYYDPTLTGANDGDDGSQLLSTGI